MSDRMDLLVFGDQAVETHTFLGDILGRGKSNTLFSSFITKAGAALREEVSQLSALDRESIPNFTTIQELSNRYNESQTVNTAVESALLCISQIAHYIGYTEEDFSESLNPSRTSIVGLCTGSLAAAAVASSPSPATLIPLAVEVVRIAFQTGLHVGATAGRVHRCVESRESWSYLVQEIGELEARQALEEFHKQQSVAISGQAYISALSANVITISGPPTILRRLFQESETLKKTRRVQIPVHAPYHAVHLHGDTNVHKILGGPDGSRFQTIDLYHPKIPVLSTVSGLPFTANNTRKLLEMVITEILNETLRLDYVLDGCVASVSNSNRSSCRVLPFGPTNVTNSIVSALNAGTKANIVTELYSSWISTRLPKGIRTPGRYEDSKLAIVGMAGRFPGAADHELFWDLLQKGLDVHREVPKDRFNVVTAFDPAGKRKNTSHTPYGCWIDEPGLFDPRFFNMSPREAAQTDPMQRLALVTAYEALEMSGYVPNRTPSTKLDRIGTFYGQTSDDWREVNIGQDIDTYFTTGGVRAFGPGRINYHFKFSGPSLNIDTACSSSMAAIQVACTSLRAGECDTAVAGGVNVMTNSDIFSGLSRGQFLSKTGPCQTFDNDADGYCRADGIGTIIIKRFDDALADNDNILAAINGTATNHSADAISITHPHAGTQERLYTKILNGAGVDALDVDYVEMHGTGTQAGDGEEMTSVTNVFAPATRKRRSSQVLHIGSVKANVGHGEASSGTTALIKCLLMMQKNAIPPHVGIKKRINQNFPKDLKERNVHIPLESKPFFARKNRTRQIYVSNFSAAGGNSGLLIEDGPERNFGDDPRSMHTMVVSAKAKGSLKHNIERLLSYLEKHPSTSAADLCYTQTARRIQHNYRVAFPVSDIADVKAGLAAKLAADISPVSNASPKIAFAFTGQGSHYASMGIDLWKHSQQFRSDIQAFEDIGRGLGFPSFLPLVDGSVSDVQSLSPLVTQLGLTCIQMALTRLWKSWAVKPSVVIGHSLGEYAALNAAGILSVSDVIYLVGERARSLQDNCTIDTHAMLAVKASSSSLEVLPGLLRDRVQVACINGPQDTVFSGLCEDIDAAAQKFSASGIKSTKLNVPYAFHSSQVDAILASFQEKAKSVTFNKATVPVISPLLGNVVMTGATVDPTYLTKHAREPVNFLGALLAAQKQQLVNEQTSWVEIGPHPVCLGMVKSTFGTKTLGVPTLRRREDAWQTVTNSLCSLYLQGVKMDWNEYYRDFSSSLRLLDLPAYSWDNKTYWIQYEGDWSLSKQDIPQRAILPAPAPEKPALSTTTVQKIVEETVKDGKVTIVVESDISRPDLHAAVTGHKVNGLCLTPSTIYGDMAMTVADYMYKLLRPGADKIGTNVSNMEAFKTLIVNPAGDKPQILRLVATTTEALDQAEFHFSSGEGKSKMDHAKCLVKFGDCSAWLDEFQRTAYLIQPRIDHLRKAALDGNAHSVQRGMAYKLFGSFVEYDRKFQGMERVIFSSADREATADIKLQTTDAEMGPYWVDSCCHLSGFIVNGTDAVDSSKEVYISHGWESLRFARPVSAEKKYRSYVRMQPSGKMMIGDVYVFEEDIVIGVCGGVKFQSIPRAILNSVLPPVGAKQSAQPKAVAAKSVPQVKTPAATKVPEKKATVTTTKTRKVVSIAPQVMAIIAEEIGMGVDELDDPLEFSDLGVDSLMSLSITGRLREDMELDLDSNVFTDQPTVGQMKTYLTQLSPPGATAEIETVTETVSEDIPTSSTPQILVTATSKVATAQVAASVTPQVLNVIAEEIGMGVDELDDPLVFAELGVDSLMSLSITGRLREDFDLDLDSNVFIDQPTVGQMKTYLAQFDAVDTQAESESDIEDHISTPGLDTGYPSADEEDSSSDNDDADDIQPRVIDGTLTPSTGISVARELHGIDVNGAAKEIKATLSVHANRPKRVATSVLLQGNSKKASKIFFMIPDGGGSATSYMAIPKLSPDVAVFGLNSPFMKTPEEFDCGVDGIATYYINELRRRQPHGPYFIGGWSAGGVIAFETAQQLIRAGEVVEKLILIDSPCPTIIEPLPSSLHRWFNSIGLLGDGLVEEKNRKIPEWLLPHFASSVTALSEYRYKAVKMDPKKTPKTLAIWCKHGVCRYPEDPRPDPYPYGHAQWLLENRTDFGPNEWDQFIDIEKISTSTMEGNHFSMMREPNIARLGDLIRTALTE